MAITRHGPKPFSWSYSRLKNFEVCPKRYYHVDVRKDFKEAESEQLRQGNIVHKLFEERLGPRKVPFPQAYKDIYEPWATRVEYGPGDIHVEQQLAITKDFAPCEWFAPNAWYRAKVDVLKKHEQFAILIDWKTGRIVEEPVQLMLSTACVFAHHPEVQVCKSIYAWLAENAESGEVIKREELPTLWSNLWERIEELREAHARDSFPPTPNHLCRSWCPVSVCPHNGRR
jgi:hypothetical protein